MSRKNPVMTSHGKERYIEKIGAPLSGVKGIQASVKFLVKYGIRLKSYQLSSIHVGHIQKYIYILNKSRIFIIKKTGKSSRRNITIVKLKPWQIETLKYHENLRPFLNNGNMKTLNVV